MKRLLSILLVMLATVGTATASERRDALLADGSAYDLALPFEDFARPAGAVVPPSPLSGRLSLDTTALSGGFQLVRDSYGVAGVPATAVRMMPEIVVDIVKVGDDIIPLAQGLIETTHPYYDLVFTPGKLWMEGERRLLSLPFALMEKNANCIHNGALLVALDGDGMASSALVQIGSETCAYFQFNFWASYDASWEAGEGKATQHPVGRLPVKGMAELPAGIVQKDLAQDDTVAAEDMTTYGLVLDGVHYRGDCMTRLGAYPHCETIVLPSYSLAKSLAGGLGLMRLEAIFGDVASRRVAELVPACADWGEVTLEHLLNMSTGRYRNRKPHVDEASEGFAPFFSATTEDDKTTFACRHFGRKASAGKRWVYHTSDTYLLGVAMNAFLETQRGEGADYYRDYLLPIWQEMGLSPLLSVMRRTNAPESAPFTGYGMLVTPDDIARLASHLTTGSTPFEGRMLDAALQRNPDDRGLPAGDRSLRYKNGFWAWNARQTLGCEVDTWLPFLSGYGGITVVLLPHGNVYYYFSDGGVHAFASAIKAISAITPICGDIS